VVLNNWSNVIVAGNLIAPQNSDCTMDLRQDLTKLSARWNNNCYLSISSRDGFHVNSKRVNFSDWKKTTGYDAASCCAAGRLHGTRVFVRPNRYEPGRANIVVYNWDNLSKVAVNVCSVLAAGTDYEVRNAEDFFSAPVISGTFDGEPLQLPMRGLTVAKPTGALKTPPATGPTFNVFVLLSRSNQGTDSFSEAKPRRS